MRYAVAGKQDAMRRVMARGAAGLRGWRFWVGLAISVGCLVLVFRGVEVHELAGALRAANYVWIVPASVLLAGSLAVRAVRWRVLFFPQTGLRFGSIFHVLNIGYLINNILPARAGDVIRAGLISTREPVSASRALGTVIVERLLDGISLVLLLVFMLPLFPMPGWIARVGQVGGVSLALVSVGLVILSTQRVRSVRWTHALLSRIPRIDGAQWAERVGDVVDGLGVLRSPLALGQAGAWSAVSWLMSGVAFYFVMQAFDLGLPVIAGLFVLTITTLVLIVPTTPGFIGVFDYTAVLALSVFGVERSLALSCAIVLHAVTYVTFSVMGLFSLLQESMSFSAVISGDRAVIADQ